MPHRLDPDGLLAGPQREPGQGRMAYPRSCGKRGADRLPAGVVPDPVFLPGGEFRVVRPRRADSRTDHRQPHAAGAGTRRRRDRVGVRAPRRGRVPQYPTTASLTRLARELAVVVIGSVFERRAAGVYHNTALVVDADGVLLGTYRKMHIPEDPLYFEKYYFTPGDLGFRCFDTRYARVAPLVCWDQWYPEAARLAALNGAQILFYPTAIGWHPSEKAGQGAAQHDAWRTIQRAHAIANGVYVAAVNRVGYEGLPDRGLDFFGGSFVADPFGQILAEASHDREETLIVECDPRRIEEVRRDWPFLPDRRIDAYGGILNRVID